MEGCVCDEQRLTETQMSAVTAETVATPSSAVGCVLLRPYRASALVLCRNCIRDALITTALMT